MNNESNVVITPINEDEKQEFIPTTKKEIKTEPKEEDFVTGLPEWDLTPPYEIIRRVNRK